jgi:hypothetical protein
MQHVYTAPHIKRIMSVIRQHERVMQTKGGRKNTFINKFIFDTMMGRSDVNRYTVLPMMAQMRIVTTMRLFKKKTHPISGSAFDPRNLTLYLRVPNIRAHTSRANPSTPVPPLASAGHPKKDAAAMK